MTVSGKSTNVAAALLGLLAFACFSTHDIFIKLLGETYSPFQIVFFSALLSFPLLTLEMIFETKPGTLRPNHPWWMLLRCISGAITAIAVFYAFSVLPLSQVYAFIFASPLIVTLLAIPILGERIRLPRALAIIVGFIGVLIVIRPGASPLSLGHLAAFIGAVAGAANAVIMRKIGRDERGVLLILYPLLANVVLTAAILPFVYVPVSGLDLGYFAIVAFLSLLAMGFLVMAYSRGDAMIVAPMQYSQMIWAALFGIVIFSEYPDFATYLGTAIVAASGIYLVWRESRGSSETTPVSRTRTRLAVPNGLRVSAMLRRRGVLPKRDKK